jgi:hypothetical protein
MLMGIELAIFAAMTLVSNWPDSADLGVAASRQQSEVLRSCWQGSLEGSPPKRSIWRNAHTGPKVCLSNGLFKQRGFVSFFE